MTREVAGSELVGLKQAQASPTLGKLPMTLWLVAEYCYAQPPAEEERKKK